MSEVDVREFAGTQHVAEVLEGIGKSVIHPKLDPRENDFTDDTSFWLVLSRDGEDFGCVGSRLEELGSEAPQDYWLRTTKRHYPEQHEVSFHHMDPSVVAGIHGRVAYMGDLYFTKSVRGSGFCEEVLRNLLALLHVTIHLKWRVNCTYAFLRHKDVLNSKPQMYHYMELTPGYQRWNNPPRGRSASEYLLTMPKLKFDHMVAILNDDPELMAWRLHQPVQGS